MTINEGLGRGREDDEYHVPDPVKHTFIHTVSKDGGEKHQRTVTTGLTSRPKHEFEHLARAHLEKQGYKIHEQVVFEGAFEKSEENKRSADDAKKQGDMFAHHLHMSDYHDNLSQWHSEKGRHSVADSHAKKSEEHHKEAMKLKEDTDLEEARKANTASARAELSKRPAKPLTGKDAEEKKKQSDDAWERLMAHAAAQKAKQHEEVEYVDEGLLGRLVSKGINALHKANQKRPLPKPQDRREYETPKTEEVACNNVGDGKIAGTQGDAGKKSVMTKPLKRQVVQFKEFADATLEEKRGLWDNIHAKRKRIKNGSGERMRKPGEKGAPTAADFKAASEEVELHFDMIEELVTSFALEQNLDSEKVWEDLELIDDEALLEYAIDAKGHKSSTGGLTQKGVDAYNRKTGGNLQTAVTTPPSKLDPDSKAAKRRKSFCARMGGVKGPMKDEKGRPTRKALALRKWNC